MLSREADKQTIQLIDNAANSLDKTSKSLGDMKDAITGLNNNILELNKVFRYSADSTRFHNTTIRWLTFALVFFSCVQAVGVFLNFSASKKVFYTHVQQKVFDECFDYHAAIEPKKGMDKTTVQTCIEKTQRFEKELNLK